MCNTYKVNYAGCRSLLPLFLSTKQLPFIETRFKNEGQKKSIIDFILKKVIKVLFYHVSQIKNILITNTCKFWCNKIL